MRPPKLTREAVVEIRARHSAGESNCAALAREYGVSRHTLWSIVKGLSWAA